MSAARAVIPRAALVTIAVAAVAAPATAGAQQVGGAQQIADPSFRTTVERPAYPTTHPRVVLDEAHHNFHTASGRYRPWAELMRGDGYDVVAGRAPFSAPSLAGVKVLVIANALGADRMADPAAAEPAFTDAECDAVRDWVRAGGSLLLIADHAPMGAAAERLANRFGVDMSKGVTADPTHHDPARPNPTMLEFSRANGLLGTHPIAEGRDSSERVSRVVTFTGQSLKGPPGSVALLALSNDAVDIPVRTLAELATTTTRVPAAGRAQGIAFTFGAGRVVVLGEAGFLSAQIIVNRAAPADTFRMGMNVPGTDDRQFALNVMHWLSGALD